MDKMLVKCDGVERTGSRIDLGRNFTTEFAPGSMSCSPNGEW